MDIYVNHFSSVKDGLKFLEGLRVSPEVYDVHITLVKANTPLAVSLSGNFLDENLNWEYVESQGYVIEKDSHSFGEYSAFLSVPENSFTITIPTNTPEQFSIPYVEAMFERLYGCKKPSYRKKTNDFMVESKKVLGRAFFREGELYHAIGTLDSIPVELDKIFTDKWLENSGKIPPSERVIGYREATNQPEATIETFAEDLKFRINEQLKNTVQNIYHIDADKESE